MPSTLPLVCMEIPNCVLCKITYYILYYLITFFFFTLLSFVFFILKTYFIGMSSLRYTLKKWCYIVLKVVIWLVIIWEPLLVLYCTKSWFFSGSLAWLRGYIAPLPYTEPVKLFYGSSGFFSGYLGWLRSYIAPLPYTEPVKLFYGSSGFFSSYLGWLRCYIAPLPYKEPVNPFKVFLRAKEPLLVQFSTSFVEEIQCNMAPLMFLHSIIWKRFCIAPLKI